MQSFIKELTIRRVEKKSEILPNRSRHLAEGVNIALLIRHATSSLNTRGDACSLASTYGRKVRRLCECIIPRGKPSRRYERDGTAAETGTERERERARKRKRR